jgi:hypothetical protein
MFVIGYALSKDADPSKRFLQGTVPAAITLSIGLTAAVVLAAALFCIAGEALLPHIMLDPLRFNSQWPWPYAAARRLNRRSSVAPHARDAGQGPLRAAAHKASLSRTAGQLGRDYGTGMREPGRYTMRC